jgi:hypothetical protein
MSSSTAAKRALLNKMNSSAFAAQLGNEVSNAVRCVKGIYDFSKVGGAVADYNLVDDDGVPVVIPSGALIVNGFFYTKTAVTSGGSATIDFQLNSANDLLAAEAKTSFDTAAKVKVLIPDYATAADWIVLTADRNLVMSVNTAALTAGKVYCYVQYVLTL